MAQPSKREKVAISEYAEYRIVCSIRDVHVLPQPANRYRAIKHLETVGQRCHGEHTLEQRLIVKHAFPWGTLLESDPQSGPRDNLFKVSLERACLKCGAEIGEACFNLTIHRQSGLKTPTSWPHAERIPLEHAAVVQ